MSLSFKLLHNSDIDCLRSLKDSLEDPLGSLESWDFTNKTEGFICRFMGVFCWHDDENKVLSIDLSDMGLRGPFPLGIQRCSSLTGLDLSGNQLNGTIPSDVGNIISTVTTLDLSSNRFSGEIPASLATCTYLNFLKLDDNQLTGQIPPEFGLLRRIKEFSVSNNRLTGPVPIFSRSTSQSYANNEGLCGGYSLGPCRAHAAKGRHSYRDFFISGFATGWAIFVLLALYISLFGFPYAAINKILIRNKVMKVNAIPSVCPGQEDTGNQDQSFEPRISKFWEATVTNPNDTASSWINPVDEYGENFSPYTKDVYCFGIVLLQLITRKEAYELGCCTDIIFGSYTTTSPLQIDEVLTHAGFDDSISQFLEIGKSCVKFMPNQRPTMLQVYESLSSIAHPWVIHNASTISME
nr:probably inactive leucine-rich repeat receptor-like protein kinase At5g48380 [Ipomoea batatas]